MTPARAYADASALPEGFVFAPDFITEPEELELVEQLGRLPFQEVVFRGVVANRRVLHFGYGYEYNSGKVSPGPPLPVFLLPLRRSVAEWMGAAADALQEVLVTEYRPGAGIGWHRDAPAFGKVAGVSLLGDCDFRFRLPAHGKGETAESLRFRLPRRSVYLLDGPARTRWQHSIPDVEGFRYSLTFRTLRRPLLAETAVQASTSRRKSQRSTRQDP
jgi:alkylated DNA repair protein (DNA oxidative demethylase)